MTAHRPIVLVTGSPSTLRRLIDGDALVVEELVDRNGATWLKTTAVASSVNRMNIKAAASGGTLVMAAEGSSSNIPVEITPKGTSWLSAGGDLLVAELRTQALKNKDLTDPSNSIAFNAGFGSLRLLVKDPAAATFSSVGFAAAPTTDGTVTTADSTVRPLCAFATAASTNADAGIATATTVSRRGFLPETFIPMRFGGSVSNMRLWMGHMSADLASVTTPTTQHVAAFRFDDVAGDTTLKCVTCDGTTATVASAGVAPVAGDHRELRIKQMAASVRFYVDNVLVYESLTNLPGATSETGIRIRVRTLDSSAKTIRVGSVSLWMK